MRSALFFVLCLSLLPVSAAAQIAPECAGVQPGPGYDEFKQRAFLQNYFAASTIMTPLGPILPFATQKASIGFDVGFIPPLNCQQRLVVYGEPKTENTNLTPVLPRPRLSVQLPDLGPVAFSTGLSVIPPIATPLGTFLHAGAELAIGWRSSFGLNIGGRGHFNMTRVREELATPLKNGDPAIDDMFIASTFGGDFGASYQLPFEAFNWLTPFISAGYAGTRTLFIIGDDNAIEQNYRYPWSGALIAGGLRALTCSEHCEFSIEASSAIPIFTTVKAKLAFVW